MSRIRTSNEGFSEILLVGNTGWRREGGEGEGGIIPSMDWE